ncbi:PAS domain S-box protein [Priestia endophytica]|uniref:PAS domain S-box protein n=1 Tax=Priestia endophytica TaxID=135735 RepID=UPI0016295729|nr:PAS domain S-box protein [Priestia endophytica]MED4072429.1 PAS domain S-box protein [Priestia endophytica]
MKLIQNRNTILVKLLWFFFMADLIAIFTVNSKVEVVYTFIGFSAIVGLCLLIPLSALILYCKNHAITMYSIITAFYIYIVYLIMSNPSLVNYLFLLLGIMICFFYQDGKLIVLSSIVSILLLGYFYTTQFSIIVESMTKFDVIYFILFIIFSAILYGYYARFTNRLWLKVFSEVKEKEEALHSAQEHFQAFFMYNNDAMVVVDLLGNVINVNPAYERIYGWKKEDILGEFLPSIPRTHIKEARQRFCRVENGERIIGFETVDMCKDGTLIHVEITISPIYNQFGKVIALSEICRDITERKATEELLRQRDKLVLAGEMAAGVAHEVRNPLTSLNGFIQLIHETDSKHRTYTTIMLSELKRINDIVGEFLLLAKPQSLHMEIGLLEKVLSDVTLLFKTEGALNNISISLEPFQEPAYIQGDTNQLKQVFINLLKNSLEAMPNGGKIIITPKTTEDGFVDIFIKDNGVGISKALLSKIQEPFFTTKEKGTGLGLVIIQNILHQHQGSFVIYDSKIHEGTTVRVRLPVVNISK